MPEILDPLGQASNEQLLEMSTREIQRAHREGFRVVLELAPDSAMVLVSNLQLACRHPDLSGDMRDRAEDIAHIVGTALGADRPALKEIIRRGWLLGGNPYPEVPN